MKTSVPRLVSRFPWFCVSTHLHRIFGALLAHCLLSTALAQTGETGVITGRIINASTGEYVRDAQVKVAGTVLSALSEGEGAYRITNVPAGRATVMVAYTGFSTEPAQVQISAGQETIQNFTLVSTFDRKAVGQAIQLEAFHVNSVREGYAKAIMQQRASMDITTSVATDTFGQVGDQNIAEFLKNLAGVDTTRVAGGIRNVQLRGLPAEYTAVNVDGLSPAVADANTGAAGNARAISFEQLSLSSIESVEISKTVSADQDASAPAGTINLKMRRAFDLPGRRIAWELNTTAFSEEFHLRRSLGPDEVRRRRIFPGGSLSYSDVLLNRRLGLAVNFTSANTFSAITRGTVAYNVAPTAADPRPVVTNTISLLHGQRLFGRTGASLTADFKATPSLVLSLGIIYNYLDQWSPQSTVAFATGGRAGVSGANPLLDFTAGGTATNVSATYQGISKIGRTTSYSPRFEYKRGDFKLEGKLGYSDATSFYNPLSEHNAPPTLGNPTLTGVSYRVTRSTPERADFKITQLSGPDWSSGTRFTAPSLTADDGRYQRSRRYSGQLEGTLKTTTFLPIEWRAGIKASRIAIRFDVTTAWNIYNYTGPGSGVGAWAAYQSPYVADLGPIGASVVSSSGAPVFYPYLTAIGSLFRTRPEYFTQVATAANFNTAFVVNHKDFTEDVNAGFLMGTTRLGKLQLRAGVRREDTALDSLQFDPQTPAAVVAAGYATSAGLATTVPGVQYQYFSKPRIHRTTDYRNYFPSAAAKYNLLSNLEAQIGFSKTIRRPTFRDIAGVMVINDQNQTVSIPNPNLQPERSTNLSARLAYYFEPVGMLAVNAFQNTVRGLHASSRLTAEQYGYTGQDLRTYTFITAVQSLDEIKVRGLELEYRQSLSFLPQPFKGFTVHANYSRTYAEVTYPSLAPHRVAGGLSYSFGRLGLYTNLNWSDDTPGSLDGNNYTRHRLDADIGGAWKLTSRVNFFFTAKNILNTSNTLLTNRLRGPAVATTHEVWGTEWVFGFKGRF